MLENRREVVSGLRQKGFKTSRHKGTDVLTYEGQNGLKIPIKFAIPDGRRYRELRNPMLRRIAKQCKLNMAQLQALVDCSLSQEEYEEILDAAMSAVVEPASQAEGS